MSLPEAELDGRGPHDDSLDRAAEIRGELLMIWGRQDPHVPLATPRDPSRAGGRGHALHLAGVQRRARVPARRRLPLRPELAVTCYSLELGLFRRELGDGDARPPTASTATKTKS